MHYHVNTLTHSIFNYQLFSMSDDRFGMAKPYMVIRRGKGRGTARATEKKKNMKTEI